ncbi:hypothetical protein [Actinocrispum sp. NPDC049592]|uniref:hypothetical protein n=1 Tax=Actinocrispum sp. NPDC049592 TaxID=3154835 RepID=UPI00344293C5
MIDVLATALSFAALGVAAWSLVLILVNRRFALNRPYGLALAGAILVVELGLLVQAVAGVIAMISSGRSTDVLVLVGYLAGPVLIVPLAAVWAAAERTRWGPGVLVIGFLAVPVMILRLRQVWSGHA